MGLTVGTFSATAVSGMLVILSLLRWLGAPGDAYSEDEFKRALLGSGIDAVHHEVYASVGEAMWEEFVKPDFMRALTVRVATETNNALPVPNDLVRWVSEHPEEAREMMRTYRVERRSNR